MKIECKIYKCDRRFCKKEAIYVVGINQYACEDHVAELQTIQMERGKPYQKEEINIRKEVLDFRPTH